VELVFVLPQIKTLKTNYLCPYAQYTPPAPTKRNYQVASRRRCVLGFMHYSISFVHKILEINLQRKMLGHIDTFFARLIFTDASTKRKYILQVKRRPEIIIVAHAVPCSLILRN